MTILPNIIDFNLQKKRILIRADLNVPIEKGNILNDRRIQAILPTIEYALSQNAAVILLSHLGRPTLPTNNHAFSLAPLANCLSVYLQQPIPLIQHWVDGVAVKPGEVVLCENVRLQTGEHTNDSALAKKIAQLADIIVMDAFGVAHRSEASTLGVIEYAKTACAGLLLASEIESLETLQSPEKPFMAIVGGAKISTKIKTLHQLIPRLGHLFIGGALANNFLKAQSYEIGQSFYEKSCVDEVKKLLTEAKQHQCHIHLPKDVITYVENPTNSLTYKTKSIQDIESNESIGDIGPLTIASYINELQEANTIFWNGPMGIFEYPHFQTGTQAIARALERDTNFSIAGGGETVAAIDHFQCYPDRLSTGGGALLSWLSGESLPMITALAKHQATHQSEV